MRKTGKSSPRRGRGTVRAADGGGVVRARSSLEALSDSRSLFRLHALSPQASTPPPPPSAAVPLPSRGRIWAVNEVWGLAAHHLLLSAAALGLALVIALPLGLVAARRARLAAASLGVAGVIQTIPGLALLALFYPLLLAIGHGLPALGFLPAWLALALYALLPILRNVVAGLRGLDPGVIQAADGLGMTAWQRLRLVEAPLAAPVVMAGIRTATVWTIGAATLATTVGASSLGNLIFSGLQSEDWTQVLTGCLASALLALAADALLALVERGLARARTLVAAARRGGCGDRAAARLRAAARRHRPAQHRRRRQEFLRTVHPGAADRRSARTRGLYGELSPGARLAGRAARAPAGRHRRLCRIFGDDLGRCDAPRHRRAACRDACRHRRLSASRAAQRWSGRWASRTPMRWR